jgi:hypothetical protein
MLSAKDEKDRQVAAQIPEVRKAECDAIPATTALTDLPDDCLKLIASPTSAVRGLKKIFQ